MCAGTLAWLHKDAYVGYLLSYPFLKIITIFFFFEFLAFIDPFIVPPDGVYFRSSKISVTSKFLRLFDTPIGEGKRIYFNLYYWNYLRGQINELYSSLIFFIQFGSACDLKTYFPTTRSRRWLVALESKN